MWQQGIMEDLHVTGLRGHLPIIIGIFDGKTTYSNLHSHELGVPQRSILAMTLFGMKVNSIATIACCHCQKEVRSVL